MLASSSHPRKYSREIGEANGTNGHGKPREAPSVPCVDWEDLRETVQTAVRFLDDVIEMNRYPLPEIEEMSRGNRRIGLGVMGFADALTKLGVPYDSDRAFTLAESISEWMDRHAWEASRELAKERGIFANYEGSTHEARGDRVRNATVTTIAPTGTISMIAGCSGGIEPLFAVAFMRRQAGMEMPDVHPGFVAVAKERGFYSEELMEKVAREGSVQGIEEVPAEVRAVFRTSSDISAREPRPDAGRLPEAHLHGNIQDHKPSPRGDGRRRRGCLPLGIRYRLQGHSRLPRRLP